MKSFLFLSITAVTSIALGQATYTLELNLTPTSTCRIQQNNPSLNQVVATIIEPGPSSIPGIKKQIHVKRVYSQLPEVDIVKIESFVQKMAGRDNQVLVEQDQFPKYSVLTSDANGLTAKKTFWLGQNSIAGDIDSSTEMKTLMDKLCPF